MKRIYYLIKSSISNNKLSEDLENACKSLQISTDAVVDEFFKREYDKYPLLHRVSRCPSLTAFLLSDNDELIFEMSHNKIQGISDFIQEFESRCKLVEEEQAEQP